MLSSDDNYKLQMAASTSSRRPSDSPCPGRCPARGERLRSASKVEWDNDSNEKMHWWLDADDIPACKRCCECRELQPLTHYTTQKEARDKHASRCKLCTTASSKLLRHLRLRYPRPPPGTPCVYCDQPANKHHLDHDHELPFPECFRGYSCTSCSQRYRRPYYP